MTLRIRRRRARGLAAAVVLVVLTTFQVTLGITPAQAATTLPPGFVETRLPYELQFPAAMAVAPDGRLFVGDRQGTLRVFKNDVLLPTPALQLTVSVSGERGLIGIAFDPDFAQNQHLYLYYTATTPTIHNRVSRFTLDGDVVVPGSELPLLDLDDLVSDQHNGGALAFGKDGKLYVTTGDNYHAPNAQTLSNLLGKVLRIDRDGTIPTDNPFYGSATGRNRAIWALGLRNPFTMAIQPGSGRVFVNDVGHVSWEEINEGVAGSNYGWPTTEGPTDDARFRAPLHAYAHGFGTSTETGCAITGGTFYNPATPAFPAAYLGKYFFIDYCNKWINTYDPATGAVAPFASGFSVWNTVYVTTAPDGSLYYMTSADPNGKGAIFKIRYSGDLSPQIGDQPQDASVTAGQPATFSVSAYGAEPLSYQWQANGTDVPGAVGASYTTPPTTAADDGTSFRVLVTNQHGSATSRQATLTVLTDHPPTGTVVQPAADTTYRAGDVVPFSATGTDPEDGDLPASAFSWRVDLHHNTHVHPGVLTAEGASGSFTVPDVGETSTNVHYRFVLTTTDSAGRSSTTTRDITPVLSQITLRTEPSGLTVDLDGSPVTSPYAEPGVVGMKRTVSAAATQSVGGKVYEFVRWSDDGAASHQITTPEAATTYTAVYRLRSSGTLSGSPNPLYVGPNASAGALQLSWSSTGTTTVEVRVGSPTGALFAASGAGSHSATTGAWVTDGTTFYLQDRTGGMALTAAGTLATFKASVIRSWGQISLRQNPITQNDGTGKAVATVDWTSVKPRVEVRLHQATGKRFAASGAGSFSADTGKWVQDGTTFYLVELSSTGQLVSVIGSVQARVRSGSISASPNPIISSTSTGVTKLSWKTAGVTTAEVRVGAPDGPLFSRSRGGVASATTGDWVKDGMVFYLQDVTGDLPLTASHTLATVTVAVTSGTTSTSKATTRAVSSRSAT